MHRCHPQRAKRGRGSRRRQGRTAPMAVVHDASLRDNIVSLPGGNAQVRQTNRDMALFLRDMLLNDPADRGRGFRPRPGSARFQVVDGGASWPEPTSCLPGTSPRFTTASSFRSSSKRMRAISPSGSPKPSLSDVLETAAGTGVLTRALASRLPQARIIATDLNQPMLDHAAGRQPSKASSGLAPSRCPRAAVRGRELRRRRLPVRRDVLSRQGPGFPRGAPRAAPGRSLRLQRVGQDRGQRVRRVRDGRARGPVPGGPATVPGPHAARLSRARGNPRRPDRRRVHERSSSRASSIAAARPRRGTLQSPTARAPRCAARSKRATRRGSTRRPSARRRPWRPCSAPVRSTAASAPSS